MNFIDKDSILKMIDKLISMYESGGLGWEIMPEDANPQFEKSSNENYLYFTLPTALNYQRNSYILWDNALKTYNDETTRFVFNPKLCLEKSFVSGNVIFGLKEDDEITLVITADNNTNLTFDGSTNAKLSVLKLD